ncbi:MAG: uracil-DNA glycosylase [Deltaproteobacteria bacterium]|nr:uracil-DNA glycosylase [Deltaproteobacteria bacterium]
MSRPSWQEFREYLLCRGRLGLARVSGSPADLERLAAKLFPTAPPGPSPAAAPPGAGPDQGPWPAPLPPAVGTLEQIRAFMGECTRCPLARGRSRLVFGEGPEPARLMLIGEAPGAAEDRQGRPFVGPAGQLLARMLAAVGISREEVFITNLVKCRPPENRDPEPGERAACRPFLEAQVRAVAPELILGLGRLAAQALWDRPDPVSQLRGQRGEVGGVPLLTTFHPAYLLRSPGHKALAYQDLKAAARCLARDPAPAGP